MFLVVREAGYSTAPPCPIPRERNPICAEGNEGDNMNENEIERIKEMESKLTPEEKQARVDKFMKTPYFIGIYREAQQEYQRLKKLQKETHAFRDKTDYQLLKKAFENLHNNREKKKLEKVIIGQKNWIKELEKAIEKPDIKLYYSYLKTMMKALEEHVPDILGE